METIESLFNRFKTYKVDIEGKNGSTMDYYIVIIKDFLNTKNIKTKEQLINVKERDIRDWLSILANEKNNSAATRNKKLVAVKVFFKYLELQEKEEIDRSIDLMVYAKAPKKETKCPTSDEMDTLLFVARNLRVKACIKIIITTGVRYSELMQITCQDIENGFAYIIGKGNKERKISFSPSCIAICKRYIKYKRDKIVKKHNVTTDRLIISDEGNEYALCSFTESLKFYSRQAGIIWSDEMSSHKLRHGYITKKLEKGIPIHIVSKAVGHSNIATTNTYAHANQRLIDEMMTEED